MRTTGQKGRRVKKVLSKCNDIVRTYDNIQTAYADAVQADDSVKSFSCNVPIEVADGASYTTDFLCQKTDGSYMVRECVFRKQLYYPKICKQLDMSRVYWLNKGITDWAIVVEKE